MANGTTTRYTQDLASPLSQILQTQGSTTTDYFSGLDRLAALNSGVKGWYLGDALGSVRRTLTDASAASTPLNYDPWGTPESGATPPTFGFTGEQQDSATGLVNLRARWYSTAHGTFTARDPFAGSPEQPYSQHPYEYGFSDPVLSTDPSGMQAECASLPWPTNAGCYLQDPNIRTGAVIAAPTVVAAIVACAASVICPIVLGISAAVVTSAACAQGHYGCTPVHGTYTGPQMEPAPGPALPAPGTLPPPATATPTPTPSSSGAVAQSAPVPSSRLLGVATGTNCDVQTRTDNRPPQRKVLIIGESRPLFDYTTGLALRHPDWDITTTTYGLAGAARPGGLQIPQINLGRVGNVTLLTNVDATSLDQGYTGSQRYDGIIFNNPYVESNVGPLTALLIGRFVFSARRQLTPSGEVHINATQELSKDYPEVGSVLSTATGSYGTFGQSPYFAPYVPRYTRGGPIRRYWNPADAANLRNFFWK